MKPSRLARTFACIGAVLLICGCGDKPDEGQLPNLGADGPVTVSGISSGGYMAAQFLVAHSSRVDGAAIIAAGPWGCALGSMQQALDVCIAGDAIENEPLHGRAAELSAAGQIDALAELADSRLYLFRGGRDAVVGAAAMQRARDWFGTYTDVDSIAVSDDVPVVHGWPTQDFGAGCDSFEPPFINDCDFDLAGELLAELIPELPNTRSASVADVQPFDQRLYAQAALSDTGYVYVPEACRSQSGCAVHVFFHGCNQSADTIGTTLVEHAGFNAWAEANRIVVLYPQVAPSAIAPLNPLGCWDWWGYSGDDYLAKQAPQISAVHAMIERLASR